MSTETYLLIAIAGLLAVIALTLIFVVAMTGSNRFSYRFVAEINEATKSLGEATKHYVQVNAVLALVDEFHERPELMERLPEYTRQVVAAALLTRANGIAHNIEVVQGQLSIDEQKLARYGEYHRPEVKRNRARLIDLQEDLEAVNTAAELFAGAPATS